MDILAEGVKAETLNRQELGDAIFAKLQERYEGKEKVIGADAMRYHERMIMLSVLDSQWKDHLLGMDHLKEGIGLRGYGQHDPLVEYKRESFDMFEAMMQRFQEDTVRYLYLMQIIERPAERTMAAGEDGAPSGNGHRPRHVETSVDEIEEAFQRKKNENWNTPAWLVLESANLCSKWCAPRRKLGVMIHVPAARERNIKSAAAQTAKPCRVNALTSR